MLTLSLDARLLDILGTKAHELRCTMIAAGCAPDHVHVVVRLSPAESLGELVRRMKGASSYELNHDARLPRRFGWQEGYWAESFASADVDSIARYVRGQREHHDLSHPAERWAAMDAW